MNMSGLIIKMIIFLVLMLIGYISVKKGIAGPEFSKTTSKLILNIFMPATILNSILNAGVNLGISELFYLIAVMTISILSCLVLGMIFAALLPVEKKIKVDFELAIGFANIMFFALPVLDELFGSVSVFYCTLASIPFNLLIFTYGIWKLQKGGKSSKIKLKDVMSPTLIATLLAILLLILKVPAPRAASELLKTLSGATVPLSMILIGTSMGSASLKDAFTRKELYIVSFIKLLLAPLAAWLVCRLFIHDRELMYAVVICAASPAATMLSALAIRYGEDGEFPSLAILHSTTLSLITIPLVVFLLNLTGV